MSPGVNRGACVSRARERPPVTERVGATLHGRQGSALWSPTHEDWSREPYVGLVRAPARSTEYSMLDGAARLDDLFTEAARLEMPAIATIPITAACSRAYDFYKKGRSTVSSRSSASRALRPAGRHTRAPCDFGNVPGDEVGEDGTPTMKGKQAYTTMTVRAETTEGMHNLFRLSSMASIEGTTVPRFDRTADRYGKGFIATTGCPSGEVNTRVAGRAVRPRGSRRC